MVDWRLTSQQGNCDHDQRCRTGLYIVLSPEGSLTCAESTTHGAHSLTFLAEDGVCKQCLLCQHCWCPRLGIEPAAPLYDCQLSTTPPATMYTPPRVNLVNIFCLAVKLTYKPVACTYYPALPDYLVLPEPKLSLLALHSSQMKLLFYCKLGEHPFFDMA